MRMPARLNATTTDTLCVMDQDVRVLTAIVPAAIDSAARVRGQNELSPSTALHCAVHTVAVLHVIYRHLAGIEWVSFTRILSATIDSAAHTVGDEAVNIELAVRTRIVSGTVDLIHIRPLNIGALTRDITITN